MFHPVWIHSASTLDQITVWSLCTHTHALQTREEMQMPPHLFLDGSFVLYLLNLNKRCFHCCSISTDRRVAPSVPSEAYDCIYFGIFQPRCDGGTSLSTVSDGHCFHYKRRDSVCLCVTMSQKVCGKAALCSVSFV